jgi:capsular polysaccharide biosynthesis protein
MFFKWIKQCVIFLKEQIILFSNLYLHWSNIPFLKGILKTKKYIKAYDVEHKQLMPPITLDASVYWKFEQKLELDFEECFVAEIENGSVWGNQGAVIDPDNIFFSQVSREFNFSGKDHSIFKQIKLVKATYSDATVAVLSASGSSVYYHWMLDIIPRIHLLQKEGLIERIDFFVVNYSGLPFQNETLERFGIPIEKIIISKDHWNFHLKAKKLIVPSLPSPNDIPSKWSCDFIRDSFVHSKPISEHSKRRLYLQRRHSRVIINELQILETLKEYNFETHILENYSIQEQATLFSEAEFIVAPHGASLTNLVFCQPGTKVIDIFSPLWINPCYWIISNYMSLKYAYLIGEGDFPSGNINSKGKGDDILVNEVKLKALIIKLLD